MNKEQILSIVRTILKTIGAVLVTKGYTDADGLESLIGGLSAGIGLLWSALAHRQK